MAALADSNATTLPNLQALHDAARARSVELSIHQVTGAEAIPAAIDDAKASAAEALNVLASPLLFVYRQVIMERVTALRLPAIYQFPEMAAEGGFIAYGPTLIHIYRELMAPPYRRSSDVSRGGLRRTCPERPVQQRHRAARAAPVFSVEVLNGGAAAGSVTFAEDFLKVAVQKAQ
jgi:hypothetical protein